jgi:hypothetical protein
MAVSYASEYPDILVDPAVKAFFEKFYATSDAPDAHESYAKSFTPNATLVMASTTVRGYSGRYWKGALHQERELNIPQPF